MSDVIVTTPKAEMRNSALEAANCIAAGGGYYFRKFGYMKDGKISGYPRHLQAGERLWYVEDGYVRGYAIVDQAYLDDSGYYCETTGRRYEPGFYVVMRADSWTWVKPVKYRGFQGWKYHIQGISPEPVGGWLDPRPVPNET